MTTLSQYLKAERPDNTEPASFHVPGLKDWQQYSTVRGRAKLASRSDAPQERVYPTEAEEE